VPKSTIAPPAARTQSPNKDRDLVTMFRGAKLLQRTHPAAFAHLARGVAFRLEDVGTPATLALAEAILRQFPADAREEAQTQ
jgi:hypothetical protein